MKTFIKISLCCFTFLLCLSAQAQEKADNSEEEIAVSTSLIEKYNSIIGNYQNKPVKELPKNKRNAILVAKAKKTILSNDTSDYFGLYETPGIEYVKITDDRYMPKIEKLYGKMAYRINFYKSPDKKEFKHIVYIMEDTGQVKFLTNITFITSQ